MHLEGKRVHELAEELGFNRQELVNTINDLDFGFTVNNFMSRLSKSEVGLVKEALKEIQAPHSVAPSNAPIIPAGARCPKCREVAQIGHSSSTEEPICAACHTKLSMVDIDCQDCGTKTRVSISRFAKGAEPVCGQCGGPFARSPESEETIAAESSHRTPSNMNTSSTESEDIESLLDELERRLSGAPWVDTADLAKEINGIRLELERPVRLSFVGDFSVGKSMVINSILGEELAPVDQTPTTAVICHFRYGDTKRVRFHYKDGSVEEEGFFAFKQFSDHSQIDEDEDAEQIERIQQIDHVEIFYPNETLRNITLVDTPGMGAVTEKDEETTRAHLRDADAVCWVFDAEAVGKGDEVKRIRGLADEFRSAFALVNQCDKKPPRARPKLQKRVEELVGEHFDDVLLYSAQETLESKLGEIELFDADVKHLTTELDVEVKRRVTEHAQELRCRRAQDQLSRLSASLIEKLEYWNDGLDIYLSFFDRLDSELGSVESRFVRKASRKLTQLNRRLKNAAISNARNLKRSFSFEQGVFSNDGGVNRSGVERFHDKTFDKIMEAFEGWSDFLGEFKGEIGEVWERIHDDSFPSNDNGSEERPEPENHNAQIVEIWRSFDRFEHSFWRSVDIWQAIIFDSYSNSPQNRVLGALNGTFRTLYSLGGLHDVARVFHEESLSEFRNDINIYIYPEHPKETLKENIQSNDPAINYFRGCFEDLQDILEEFQEGFEKRKSALQDQREFLKSI